MKSSCWRLLFWLGWRRFSSPFASKISSGSFSLGSGIFNQVFQCPLIRDELFDENIECRSKFLSEFLFQRSKSHSEFFFVPVGHLTMLSIRAFPAIYMYKMYEIVFVVPLSSHWLSRSPSSRSASSPTLSNHLTALETINT